MLYIFDVNIHNKNQRNYVFHRMGRHRIHVQGRTGADVTIRGLTDHWCLPVHRLKGHLPGCYSSMNFVYKVGNISLGLY